MVRRLRGGDIDDALQQAPAPYALQVLGETVHKLLEPVAQLFASGCDVGQQISSFDFGGHRQPRPAGKGIAAEGAGMVAGFKKVGSFAHE